jgi:hypothetical protein
MNTALRATIAIVVLSGAVVLSSGVAAAAQSPRPPLVFGRAKPSGTMRYRPPAFTWPIVILGSGGDQRPPRQGGPSSGEGAVTRFSGPRLPRAISR